MVRPNWLDEAERVDHAVYAAIAGTQTPQLDEAMSRLTRAADYSRLSLGAAGVLALAHGARGRAAARAGLLSIGITSAFVNLAIKPVSRRHRPNRGAEPVERTQRVGMPRSKSFPSGHSASAFAFATGVGRVLPAEAAALRALAALVAYSRVHTGVHYPADALAGALLGAAIAQLTTHVLVPDGPRERT